MSKNQFLERIYIRTQAKVATEYLSPEQIPRLETEFQISNTFCTLNIKSDKDFGELKHFSAWQIGSIVVEAISLLLRILGHGVQRDSKVEAAAQFGKELAKSSRVLGAVYNLKHVFSSDAFIYNKAIAICKILKAVWKVKERGEMFTEILTHLLSDLTCWEIAKIVAKVTVVVAVAFGCNGVARVATIALALMSVCDEFEKNVSNLSSLCKLEENTGCIPNKL